MKAVILSVLSARVVVMMLKAAVVSVLPQSKKQIAIAASALFVTVQAVVVLVSIVVELV